jgi:transcriptional regulator with XRE-family HTH domain
MRKGVSVMTKYIDNVNAYMSQMKIKQTYVSLKTGIDTKKLSRILTGTQDISATDMEKIANALGRKIEFFLNDSFSVPQIIDFETEKISFYAGEPTEKQEKIANKLLQLMENMDEVMSAKSRFLNIWEETHED